MRAALPLLLISSVALANLPPGSIIDPAVAVDFTPAGFESLEAIAASLIPTGIAIPDVYLAGSDEQCFIWCWDWYSYEVFTDGLDVGVNLSRFDLIPRTGNLDLDLEVTVNVASRGNPGRLYAFGEVIDLISVEEDCDVWLDPTPISVHTRVDASLVGDVVDFDIRPINIELDISQLHIEDCSFELILDLIDILDDILGFFGFDIYTLIADAVEPLVEDQINALLPELEKTLEDTLSQLKVEESIPLGDVNLLLSVEPSELTIVPEGMRVGLQGSISPDGPPAQCVSRYVSSGSHETPGQAPPIGDGADLWYHHLGLFIDDDFVNQGLWSAWYGGLLCVSFDQSSVADLGLPIPVDTSLLKILASGYYDDLFPEAAPLVFATAPKAPPIAYVSPQHALNVALDDFGLDLYAELDGRLFRVAGFDVAADVGVDLSFNDGTGELAAGIAFDPADLDIAVGFNDIKPEATAQLESGINGIVGTLLTPLLGGLTDSLSFALPSISGLGLQELSMAPAGPMGEHLGGYATIGLVDYSTGFDPEAGCSTGCEDSGCSHGGPLSLAWTALGMVWVARRRRHKVVPS